MSSIVTPFSYGGNKEFQVLEYSFQGNYGVQGNLSSPKVVTLTRDGATTTYDDTTLWPKLADRSDSRFPNLNDGWWPLSVQSCYLSENHLGVSIAGYEWDNSGGAPAPIVYIINNSEYGYQLDTNKIRVNAFFYRFV